MLDRELWLASVDPGNWRRRCSIWYSTRATPCHGGKLTVEVRKRRSINPMWTSMAKPGPAITSWSP